MSDFNTPTRSHDLLLIGGGAAALGVLCSMIRTGSDEDRSILMLDDAPGRCGRSGAYAHHYDVPVSTLRDALAGLPDSVWTDRELVSSVEGLSGDNRVPRPCVEAFLGRLKRLVLNHLRRNGSLILRAARCDTLRHDMGLWRVENQPGSASRRTILACGASEKKTSILATLLDCGLAPDQLEKVVRSTDALGADRDAVLQRMAATSDPVIVLGRSETDAQSVRHQLQDWGSTAQVKMMSRDGVSDDDITSALSKAGLIITALGESPNFPRILVDGQAVKMGGACSVDPFAQLMDFSGTVLPNIHAIGPALTAQTQTVHDMDAPQELASWFGAQGEAVADPVWSMSGCMDARNVAA